MPPPPSLTLRKIDSRESGGGTTALLPVLYFLPKGSDH